MRRWRVGSLTMGVVLLAFGILLLVSFFVKFNAVNIILMLWPIVLICLAAEIIIQLFIKRDEDVRIRYDALSIVFISVILFISTGIYSLTSFVNLFGSRQDFYIAANIRPESVSKDYSRALDQAQSLKISYGVNHVKVLPSTDDAIVTEYFIKADTNDKDYASGVFDQLVKFNGRENTLLVSNADMDSYDERIGYLHVSCVVYLPPEKTLDLTDFNGQYSVDGSLKSQVNEPGQHMDMDI